VSGSATIEVDGAAARPSRARAWRARLGPGGVTAAAILLALVAVAVLAPLIAAQDPEFSDLAQVNLTPSADHWLGTDSSGRDLFSRLVWGARTSLLGPAIVVVFSTVVGTALALAVAWKRGWLDTVASRGFDVIFAFPGVLLAILAVAIFGKGLMPAALALSISYTPYVFRLVRAAVIRESARPYIAVLRGQGFGIGRISVRHLLPNISGLIVAQSSVLFAYAMADLAAISFLGLGVQPPRADWGLMISGGLRGRPQGEPLESILPAVMIAITIVSANVLGSKFGDRDHLLKRCPPSWRPAGSRWPCRSRGGCATWSPAST